MRKIAAGLATSLGAPLADWRLRYRNQRGRKGIPSLSFER